MAKTITSGGGAVATKPAAKPEQKVPDKSSFKKAWGIGDENFDKKLALFLKSKDGKPKPAETVEFLRKYFGAQSLDAILARAAKELVA